MPCVRFRRVAFTLFCDVQGETSYTSESVQDGLDRLGSQYSIFQEERCPDSGKNHFQGYARFAKRVAFNAIKAKFPTMHLERCKGNELSNIAYCSKSASRLAGPWEKGNRAAPGKRNDLAIVRDLVASGSTMGEICLNEEASSYQALRAAEIMMRYKKPKSRDPVKVYWYHGSTGSGKTYSVWEEHPDLWVCSDTLHWFDGYDGEDVVLIDDFRPRFCSFEWLLRVLDQYKLKVPIKGSFTSFYPTKIYITCPYSPEECYKARSDEDVFQLNRRIFETKLFGNEVLRKDYCHQATASNFHE